MKTKMLFAMVVVLGAFSALCPAAMTTIISDDFNRPDSTNLGQTAEGYIWAKHHSGGVTNGTGTRPRIFGNELYGDHYSDYAYLSNAPAIRDFTMEFDYTRYSHVKSGWGMFVEFRITTNGVSMYGSSPQVIDPGYCLTLTGGDTNGNISATLYADWDPSNGSERNFFMQAGPIVGTVDTPWQAHIKLCATNNHITVFMDGNLLIDYTDNTPNPATNAPGYFGIHGNAWTVNSIDNFVITEDIPQPMTIILLVLGGLVGLVHLRWRRGDFEHSHQVG